MLCVCTERREAKRVLVEQNGQVVAGTGEGLGDHGAPAVVVDGDEFCLSVRGQDGELVLRVARGRNDKGSAVVVSFRGRKVLVAAVAVDLAVPRNVP